MNKYPAGTNNLTVLFKNAEGCYKKTVFYCGCAQNSGCSDCSRKGGGVNIIRVLLAEDHTIVREGIRSLLVDEEDIKVVGEARDGREAVRLAETLKPHVILMDIAMPVLNGIEATKQIKKQQPEIQVLILTMYDDETYIRYILQYGASGYILKQAAVEEVVSAIRIVSKGDSYLSPKVSRKVIDEYARIAGDGFPKDVYDSLSDREREVLQLVSEGNSNKKISDLLFISVRTVEAHRTNLMRKLDLHSISELTRYAVKRGITREK